MPRLAPKYLAQASREHYLLPLLLRPCRDLQSARLELKWLRDHALNQAGPQNDIKSGIKWKYLLHELCTKRSRGVPLQYLLGTEYFGDIEIACRPGVLIPRPETADAVFHLINRLRLSEPHRFPKGLGVLDICTGTGCIPLLFSHDFPYEELGVEGLEVVGIDISKKALSLASYNQRRLVHELESTMTDRTGKEPVDEAKVSTIKGIRFLRADVLDNFVPGSTANLSTLLQHNGKHMWDIVISNPPYISPRSFITTTSRSVRNFEPKLALVPLDTLDSNDEEQGDLFYPRLLDIAEKVDAKIVLLEVADLSQAIRVAKMARQRLRWSGMEIWRDRPDLHSSNRDLVLDRVPVIGQGNGRAVFCYTQKGSEWISRFQ